MSKLVVFDGNAIMHRAYHALPPLTGNEDQPINAVYGLISMLIKVITDLKPTHLAFAFDRPEPTFRKKLNADYQSQRPEMENDLSTQFKIAADVIKAFGIPLYDKAGYEADDVIGTIASEAEVDSVNIVTGDRDILQLVNDKVKVYMPIKGLSEGRLFGDKETKERMGVMPNKIIDFKALVGDPSDNYKGVPGIGPKTAIKLLEEYKDLEGVYKNLDNLPEKTKKLLQLNKDSAFVSQKLATIVCDVEIDFDLEKARKWDLNSDEVLKLFEKIGFRTLTERVKKLGKELDVEKQMSLI